MKARNLATLYNLPALDWNQILARLEQPIPQAPNSRGPNRHTVWLATINPDGRPHLTGVGAEFVDGAFWFVSGDQTQKSRNLARDARCALTLSTQEFDLVLEGEAQKVTEPPTVAQMAARYAAGGWPARVDESGAALIAEYSAPSAGPPPWHIYRLVAQRATVVSTTEPGGATRWDFERD
jgi:pyridoxine/pyridoxamine 5'-phosphate oxidase